MASDNGDEQHDRLERGEFVSFSWKPLPKRSAQVCWHHEPAVDELTHGNRSHAHDDRFCDDQQRQRNEQSSVRADIAQQGHRTRASCASIAESTQSVPM